MADTLTPNDPGSFDGIDLAIAVSDRVQIQNILIIESHVKRGQDEEFTGVSFGHRIANVGFTKEEETGQLSVQITIILASTEEGKPQQKPALLLMATFMLNYKVNSFEGLTDENLRAFAGTNGVFNAWPYWREFVQNMTVRMGLPPIVAPVFRVPHDAPPQTADSAPKTPPAEAAGDNPAASTD